MPRPLELILAVLVLVVAGWAVLYGLGPFMGIGFVGWCLYHFHRWSEGRRLFAVLGLIGYMGTFFGSAAAWAILMWLVGLPAR